MLRQRAAPSVSAAPSHQEGCILSHSSAHQLIAHRSYFEGSRSSSQRKTGATVVVACMGVYIELMAAHSLRLILLSLCIHRISLVKK